MKALTWHGKNDIRCESVPDPKIEHGRDAIIKVTACAICGSDLHLFDGVMPSMRVIAIDTVPDRLALAQASGAMTLDFKKEDIYDRIQELTDGRGADACIDAVGTEPDIRLRCRNRPSKGRHLHGHRSSARAAPGDPLLP